MKINDLKVLNEMNHRTPLKSVTINSENYSSLKKENEMNRQLNQNHPTCLVRREDAFSEQVWPGQKLQQTAESIDFERKTEFMFEKLMTNFDRFD